jgi:hypothetical protein
MTRVRSTIDVWYIFVNYGQNYSTKPEDAECTEFGKYQFLVNKLAYEQNCGYPVETRKGRMKKTDLPGGWNESENEFDEAKAKVEYLSTIVKQRQNPTPCLLNRLQLAIQKLERMEELRKQQKLLALDQEND